MKLTPHTALCQEMICIDLLHGHHPDISISSFSVLKKEKTVLLKIMGSMYIAITVMMLCCAQSLSHVQLCVTLWTIARQVPLSMGILQARILEWAATMPSARESSQPRDRTQVSHITGGLFTIISVGKKKRKGFFSLLPQGRKFSSGTIGLNKRIARGFSQNLHLCWIIPEKLKWRPVTD